MGYYWFGEFIKYRTQSLEKKQKELELEIAKATDEIQTAYVTLEEQHVTLEEQHNEIKDSIKYAKRIQNAILPNVELMKRILKIVMFCTCPRML